MNSEKITAAIAKVAEVETERDRVCAARENAASAFAAVEVAKLELADLVIAASEVPVEPGTAERKLELALVAGEMVRAELATDIQDLSDKLAQALTSGAIAIDEANKQRARAEAALEERNRFDVKAGCYSVDLDVARAALERATAPVDAEFAAEFERTGLSPGFERDEAQRTLDDVAPRRFASLDTLQLFVALKGVIDSRSAEDADLDAEEAANADTAEIERLGNLVEELKEAAETAKATIAELTTAAADREGERDTLALRVSELTEEIKELTEERDLLKSEFDKAVGVVEVAAGQRDIARAELEDFRVLHDRLRADLETAAESLRVADEVGKVMTPIVAAWVQVVAPWLRSASSSMVHDPAVAAALTVTP